MAVGRAFLVMRLWFAPLRGRWWIGWFVHERSASRSRPSGSHVELGGTHSRAPFFVLGALPPPREPAATLGVLQIYPHGVYLSQTSGEHDAWLQRDRFACDTDPVCGMTVQTGQADGHTTNSQKDPTLETLTRTRIGHCHGGTGLRRP